MLDREQINQLACEIIDIFNNQGIYDWYGIIANDIFYDSFKGWSNEKCNPLDWRSDWYSGKWNENFGIVYDGLVHSVFEHDPETIHETWDTYDHESSVSVIRCQRLLRRLFRRYNLEWLSGCNVVLFRTNEDGKRIRYKRLKELQRLMRDCWEEIEYQHLLEEFGN
jgi:hypothetical protein